jgi:CRP-like cAMP-binding protein
MENTMEGFLDIFSSNLKIKEEDAAFFLEQMEQKHFTKGQTIVAEGKLNTNLYVIKKGVVRGVLYFYKTNNDTGKKELVKEKCCYFFEKGQSFISPFGFAANENAKITMEAVNGVTLYCIDKKDLTSLCFKYPIIAEIYIYILNHYILEFAKNSVFFADNETAKEKYIKFIKHRPTLISQLPIKDVASFIGIKPQSLSRIRNEIIREE